MNDIDVDTLHWMRFAVDVLNGIQACQAIKVNMATDKANIPSKVGQRLTHQPASTIVIWTIGCFAK